MEINIKQEELINLSRKAGSAIIKIYNDLELAGDVDYKDDNSPLTLADKASHEVIMEGLKELYPDIPIISEEGDQLRYEDRKDFEYFWLVDPLDGTKEFINRNGQFTVNIALMNHNSPVAGFIYTPVHDSLYVGIKGECAYKVEKGEKADLKVNNSTGNRIAVRSKSHASPEEEGVLEKYDVVNDISVGSSLKFCMVAEGKADIYYRHGPTMEWDTAAGQAVLESAGGKVLKGTGPEVFSYNKENLLNGSFLCLGF
ncbi:3'(2'),5'-bisphosphate nucleotidase CysQ [Fulvivirga sp. 29W222]|uniref:3'(2'),5'-bisphosphate nucleotidase CysQ n=1 Tax=Fulvivirga marina TaxID=2494733 RepID=A0A937KES2_9BACT|nr:3'(2'),5'-bisphosphate nucleotidase CysQ [Fulvivirga marina]MBL6449869.1 3'(2'),5'-bisphosphate nucleotidase CysQ [Fulvivirga marina]